MMRTHKHLLIGIAMASLMVTSGCVKLWRKNLDIKTYMVTAERAGEPFEVSQPGKLWIDEVTVLPPSNVRNLVLRKSDVEFETSYYTELLLNPADNFRNEFYAWFSASGFFEEVGIAERRGMTHRLAATVLKFYGDVETGKAVLKVRITLIDEKSKGLRVLISRDYEREVAVEELTADNLVRAYNKALSLILTACESDLKTLF